jgi:hypothetical protein
MALKRLDEEFDLKPGTQLLPYMKRLLPSLEGRFQELEDTAQVYLRVVEDIRAAALLRMNEILVPATEAILEVTQLGFLLAPIDGEYTLVLGYMSFPIKPGAQQDTFTPSPYLIIEHTADDYAIARLMSYDQGLGILEVTITAVHGNAGPWADWVVSSTPGMADSTKLYHDAIGPMYNEILVDYQDILIKHQEIVDAANDLEAAGLDLYNYIRRDGTTPFLAVQAGVHPVIGSNDVSLATTSWTRARMNEYLMGSMSSSGATMTGPLYLYAAPSQPLMAATKAYVDAVLGAGGTMNASLTILASNPTIRLRSTGTNENRSIEALSSDGLQRWVLSLADQSPLGANNQGANFMLARYTDLGALIDYPIRIDRSNGMVQVRGDPTAALHVATKQYVDAADATKIPIAGGVTLTGGNRFTTYDAGSFGAGQTYTPNAFLGNYQLYRNVGAHTFAAPASDCALDVIIYNQSPGGITFSGFTVGQNTGDLLTTTAGHWFIISVRRIWTISTYVIKALQ